MYIKKIIICIVYREDFIPSIGRTAVYVFTIDRGTQQMSREFAIKFNIQLEHIMKYWNN